jgi:hypothetical protein
MRVQYCVSEFISLHVKSCHWYRWRLQSVRRKSAHRSTWGSNPQSSEWESYPETTRSPTRCKDVSGEQTLFSMYFNIIKLPWAISHVNVESNANVSKTSSVSIFRVSLRNDQKCWYIYQLVLAAPSLYWHVVWLAGGVRLSGQSSHREEGFKLSSAWNPAIKILITNIRCDRSWDGRRKTMTSK